jgi:hypothetical protein
MHLKRFVFFVLIGLLVAEVAFLTIQRRFRSRIPGAGKVDVPYPAPEISGADIDGKPFKLSDYRGKVVVLDFWGNW